MPGKRHEVYRKVFPETPSRLSKKNVCPVFFEEIDENRVMESEIAHSMLLDLRMS